MRNVSRHIRSIPFLCLDRFTCCWSLISLSTRRELWLISSRRSRRLRSCTGLEWWKLKRRDSLTTILWHETKRSLQISGEPTSALSLCHTLLSFRVFSSASLRIELSYWYSKNAACYWYDGRREWLFFRRIKHLEADDRATGDQTDGQNDSLKSFD